MSEKKRLGADPFDFIKSTTNKKQPERPDSRTAGLTEDWTRATFIVRKDYAEKMRDIAYWDRLSLKEVFDEALKAYIQRRERKETVPPRKRE